MGYAVPGGYFPSSKVAIEMAVDMGHGSTDRINTYGWKRCLIGIYML